MTKTISIEGMHCQHCVAAVNEALQAVAGVTSVAVSLENNNAVVEGTSLDDAALKAAVDFKVIPFKSIIAVQAKLKSTVLSGYIEFETANSPLSVGSDNAERQSENSVILSGAEERYAQAKEALQYIFAHISK